MLKTRVQSYTTIGLSFLLLGCTAFGGPMAHIAYFRKTFVDQKQWLSEAEFAQLLSLCQLLPGPASSQLGFAIGLLRAGWLGALLAFISFTLPSVMLLMLFASTLPLLSANTAEWLLHSLKLVAVIVVADAVLGMAQKLCKDSATRAIAILTFSISVFVSMPYLQLGLITLGGLLGYCFCLPSTSLAANNIQVTYSKSIGTYLLIAFAVLLLLSFIQVDAGLYQTLSQRFYQVGALVFGGGHVVLPLLNDAIVQPGMISTTTFLNGYGAAQALPGPLFSVAAYYGSQAVDPMHWQWMGAILALFAIFLPGFLLLTGVLPWWQSILQYQAGDKVMMGISAAVVGLLAATWYQPLVTSGVQHWFDVWIVVLGFICLSRWRVPVLVTIVMVGFLTWLSAFYVS